MLFIEAKYIVALFGVVSVICTTDQPREAKACPEESGQGVSWPETNSLECAMSYPLCLNENMEIISRCCDSEGNWSYLPICYHYQNVINNPCPDHFDWKGNICIFVIENTSYPPQCPYEENLSFYEYFSELDPEVLPIWMPVKRNVGDYGIDVIRWMEPSADYKLPCYYNYYSGTTSGKNCLILIKNNTYAAEEVPCDEKHNAICAYQSLPNRAQSFCSQMFSTSDACIQSNYSSQSKCFCRGDMKEHSLAPRAEFLEPYQNLLYSSLNDTCYIGLQNVSGSYFWMNSNTTIKYSNWAENAVFGKDYRYGAVTPDGWIMTKSEEEADCVLYETEITVNRGEIVLDYSKDWLRFVLTITNPNSWLFEKNESFPMVHCFTDAAKDALISKLDVTGSMLFEKEVQFYFQEHTDGPGTYWCEAFLYPEVVAKSSNKYLLRHNELYTEEYVVIVKKSYDTEVHPIDQRSVMQYQQLMTDQIQAMSGISHYIVRIYKILDLDEINFEITINFHLLNPNQSTSLTDYCRISRYMEQNLTDFTYVELFSVDTCVGVQTQSPSSTWPPTAINAAAKPREGFCVGSNGNIVNKLCSGNYIDGARWSDLSEPCTIQKSTNATVNLTNILNQNNPQEFMDQIIEISKHSAGLTVYDIELIAVFFEQVSHTTDIDTEAIATITNHLMEVPLGVLKLSQAYFNATDKILYQLHNILNQSNSIGEVIITENFIILSHDVSASNLRAVVVTENDGLHNITEIFNNTDLDDVLKVDGFKAALLLNENIISILEEYSSSSEVIVTVYKNSKLFNEMDGATRDTDVVIGITFPYIPNLTSEIATVYKIDDSEVDDIVCSFWDYEPNEKTGYWVEAKKTSLNESVITCHYDQPKHFTLVRNKRENITEQLENILKSEVPLSEKLGDASILLSNHNINVQAIDLKLVSDLMEQAAEQNEDDNLELVTDLINMIIDIPEDVLKTSQQSYNATGRILLFFEQILQNCSASQIIKKSNIYAVIQVLTDDNLFYGFTIDHCDEECNLNLLREETSAQDVALTESLDTALLLSQDLLNQHLFNGKGYVPKIVATVFLKSSLFVDTIAHPEVVTKVVGVSFPNFDEPNLNGRLTLLYDSDLKEDLNYTTCSVYQNLNSEPTIIRGFWNQETDSELRNEFQSCVFWKLKYFALIKNSMNITSSLEFLLESNDNIFTILNRTNYITKKFYMFFQPIDVFYVAQILYKARYANETILETCLDIINHIMDIDSTVLEDSRKLYKATDMILDGFNKITEMHTESTEIYKENVVLIIALLKDIKTYGILLENCSQNCIIIQLYNVDPNFESTTLFRLDAQLILSPNLLANINLADNESYIPRAVFKLFYKDALFIDVNGIRSSTQVFGIHFPDYDKMLSHEISLKMRPSTDSNSNDYNCVKWTHSDENISDGEGYWSYESKPREPDSLNCNFYQQSYFSLTLDSAVIPEVTHVLEDISMSNTSSISKLYRMQDISYYYPQFQPYDVYLFSYILGHCKEVTGNGLDMVTVVINNILRTAENVLVESSVSFNALRYTLDGINHVANLAETSQNFQLRDMFGLVVCQLKSDATNAVILTPNSFECTHEVDDASFSHAENVVTSVILSKEVVAQAIAGDENAIMIVSVFFSNAFFNIETTNNSPLILGLSIPSIDGKIDGDIVALFNYTSYGESSYDCSYWANLDVWKVEDGKISDPFKKCTYSETTYYSLLEGPSGNITKILEGIINADCTPLTRLQRTLNAIATYSKQIKALDVFLISKILSVINEVNLPCLKLTANITSSVMDLPREVLVDSQDQYNATDWILYYIDRITERIDDQEVQIITENFAIVISNNITAILVENCNSRCNIILLANEVNLTGLNTNINLNTVLIFQNSPQVQDTNPSHIAITVFYSNVLFNEGCKISYNNIGPIIGMVLPSKEGAFNGSFRFYYYTETRTAGVCAFWNYTVEDDGITKGYWKRDDTPPQPEMYSCESKHTAHFAFLQEEKNVTSDLEDVLNSNSTAKDKLDKVVLIISDLAGKLEAVDIYLISRILELAMKDIDASKMNITSEIISGLFNVSRDVLRESQTKYSATDKILHAVDEMTKILTSTGIDPITKENFTVVIYDLKNSDISGIVLEDCSEAQCSISPLEGAVNLTEIVSNEKLQTAIVLSEELRNQVRYSGSSAKLVVTIYFSDVLFNEQSERDGKVSMVCGVLLPGFNETFLGNLYVIFNSAGSSQQRYNSSCAFWNFQVLSGEESVKGSWSSDVDPQSKEKFTVCEYDHITHFALLLALDDSIFGGANKYNLLDIITAIDSVLSVVGLLGILLTATLFERWRRNTGNQILVHFSVAISIKMVMLYVSAGVYDSGPYKVACYITGAILHYSILSEFCWMLIIAILQFKRFVEVLGGPPKFVLLKACICGWLFPVLPVMLILLIDKDNYSEGQVGLCYPSGLALYLGIWLPLIIIVSINFVIFIFIIYNVFHKKTESRDLVNHEILFQWRLALLLFSMLGLTWLFGFLSQIPGAQSIFVYIFCVSATLQGFIMFLFFIVFNKSTRFLYSQSIKSWLYSRGYKEQ